eukprot:jgi/Picsp_1/2949/NSC_01173-R1_protein
MDGQPLGNFECVDCKIRDNVGLLGLNREEKNNALSAQLRQELVEALKLLVAEGARCIVLYAIGRNFCAGLDMKELESFASEPQGNAEPSCEARKRLQFMQHIRSLQKDMSAFEECPCPVIVALHGHCVGAGVDLATACDIRLATKDCTISVKEVDLGITADMGTLSRLPYIVGHGLAMYLALTAEGISGSDAEKYNHFVLKTFDSYDKLLSYSLRLAQRIAKKSPVAVTMTKKMLLFQRSHTVQDGLDHVAILNASTLLGSEDVSRVFQGRISGRKPVFSKL